MNDELEPAIAEVLGRAGTWVDLPSGLEATIVAAIDDQLAAEQTPSPRATPSTRAPRGAWQRLPSWLRAAAVIGVIAGGAVIVAEFTSDGNDPVPVTESALIGTDLAPGASATATFDPTPAGLRIVLDADGLEGAPAGEMYEAWISDGDLRVSAGTFHLRDGDGPIELWAGTDDPDFDLITVTREPIDGVADSSGAVVLSGQFSLTTTDERQYDG